MHILRLVRPWRTLEVIVASKSEDQKISVIIFVKKPYLKKIVEPAFSVADLGP